ncbi:MAG: sigma-70 family RNA polymerase sigma factor [Bacteroidota bacterium]
MLLSVFIQFLSRAKDENLDALTNCSDQELLARYRVQADPNIVSVLMERYSAQIIGMSMKYLKDEEDVKDFAGDLFIKLTEKLESTEVKNFKSWLGTTVNNRLHDMGRKTKVRQLYKSQLKEGTDEIEGRLGQSMDNHHLIKAIGQLSEKEKTCIMMIYFEEKSYHDIMEELDWTFNQVRGTRERAIRKLREALGAEFSGYFKES